MHIFRPSITYVYKTELVLSHKLRQLLQALMFFEFWWFYYGEKENLTWNIYVRDDYRKDDIAIVQRTSNTTTWHQKRKGTSLVEPTFIYVMIKLFHFIPFSLEITFVGKMLTDRWVLNDQAFSYKVHEGIILNVVRENNQEDLSKWSYPPAFNTIIIAKEVIKLLNLQIILPLLYYTNLASDFNLFRRLMIYRPFSLIKETLFIIGAKNDSTVHHDFFS